METQKEYILVVEDDEDLANSMQMKLNQMGYRTQICMRVSEAMFKLRNQKYDCILLDLHLKEGHGEKILNQIRTYDKEPNFKTPVIIVSGHLDRGFVEGHGRQVSGILVKPFDGASLIERVETTISAARKSGALQRKAG